jgi:peptidoglycan/xylan/chitin deacetylase (PgdA/CDA1 family)
MSSEFAEHRIYSRVSLNQARKAASAAKNLKAAFERAERAFVDPRYVRQVQRSYSGGLRMAIHNTLAVYSGAQDEADAGHPRVYGVCFCRRCYLAGTKRRSEGAYL